MHRPDSSTAETRASTLRPPVTIVARTVGVAPGSRRVSGTEVQLAALVTGYLAIGGSVTLICREATLPPHPRLKVHAVPAPGRPFALSEPIFIALASIAIRRWRHGLLHSTGAIVLSRVDMTTVHFCHTAYASKGLASRASRRAARHRVNAWTASHVSIAMERWCYRPSRIGVLVGPSQGLVREIQTHFPLLAERAVVIHNGVDRDVFSPQPDGGRSATRRSVSLPDDALVAIFVGGDWARKGLGKIISALRSADDWYLIVVGDGDLQTYRSLAEACGLLERVRFVGPRLDVAALYSAADAFVFPSDYEAAPLVTYEAAASGLPLLLSRINGAEELLEEGHNGWFVASAEEIASRLTQLSADRSMLARMGVAARESTRAYTWTYMAARYAELYESLDRRVKR